MSIPAPPGHYIEASRYDPGLIRPVRSDVTLFVGPMPEQAPLAGAAVHSWAEFVRHYGDALQLHIGETQVPHYMALAAWAFFHNGGQSLYLRPVGHGAQREPGAGDYAAALQASLELEDVSLLAAPGACVLGNYAAIQRTLLSHVQPAGLGRFLVLDPPPAMDFEAIRAFRDGLESVQAALYYPWLLARPGGMRQPVLQLPPSGFICGSYARSDVEHGVHRSPASQPLRGVIGVETALGHAHMVPLNQQGINCIAMVDGRAPCAWGARTLSAHPEWRYVAVRRHLEHLRRTLGQGTRWTHWEANGEALWARVRMAAEAFLHGEWRRGALAGGEPSQAYFVRCDPSIMTRTDRSSGRLVMLCGAAMLRPNEFIPFRIVQQTLPGGG